MATRAEKKSRRIAAGSPASAHRGLETGDGGEDFALVNVVVWAVRQRWPSDDEATARIRKRLTATLKAEIRRAALLIAEAERSQAGESAAGGL